MLELHLAPRRRRALGRQRDVRQRHLRRVLLHLRRQIGRPLGPVLAHLRVSREGVGEGRVQRACIPMRALMRCAPLPPLASTTPRLYHPSPVLPLASTAPRLYYPWIISPSRRCGRRRMRGQSPRRARGRAAGCPRHDARPMCRKQRPPRLGLLCPPARPASARSSSGRPPASASLGQSAGVFCLAGHTGRVFDRTLDLTL